MVYNKKTEKWRNENKGKKSRKLKTQNIFNELKAQMFLQ